MSSARKSSWTAGRTPLLALSSMLRSGSDEASRRRRFILDYLGMHIWSRRWDGQCESVREPAGGSLQCLDTGSFLRGLGNKYTCLGGDGKKTFPVDPTQAAQCLLQPRAPGESCWTEGRLVTRTCMPKGSFVF